MPYYYLSDDDIKLLQSVIDQARGERINSPTRTPMTPQRDSEVAHQAPETYIALPQPSSGIPGLTGAGTGSVGTGSFDTENNQPGYADCDIYYIVDDVVTGTPKLYPVSGFRQRVYNISASNIGKSWIPVTRDKFGRWLALSGGGGNNTDQIRFRIIDWLPGDPLTSPCEAVYAEVVQTACQSSVKVGDIVTVWDPSMCFFDLPTLMLIGTIGTAMWMSSEGMVISNFCTGQPAPGSCVWVVTHICCVEEIYGTAS